MCDRTRLCLVGGMHATSSLYNEKPELESHSMDRSLKHCLLVQTEILVNPRSWPLTPEKLSRYAMSDIGLVNSNVSRELVLANSCISIILSSELYYITFFNLHTSVIRSL